MLEEHLFPEELIEESQYMYHNSYDGNHTNE